MARGAGRPLDRAGSPPQSRRHDPSAANPKFALHCRASDCELRVQSGTRIIALLGSFDSEVRFGAGRNFGRTSESGHYGLMLANFTTLVHFSVSAAMRLPKSVGEPRNGTDPRSAKRFLRVGSESPAWISRLSFSTTATGVFAGAAIP